MAYRDYDTWGCVALCEKGVSLQRIKNQNRRNMKRGLVFLALLLPFAAFAQFERYFEDATLRVDYSHSGRVGVEYYNVERFLKIPDWAGSKVNLIDTLGLGVHKIEMREKANGKLLFSKGYCSLMEEWLTMEEAKNSCGNFQETILLPFPKVEVELVFFTRDKKNVYKEIARIDLDRSALEYVQESEFAKRITLHQSAPSNKALDVIFVPAGYSESEKEKMYADLEVLTRQFFSKSPFSDARDKVNIWAVERFDSESGIPGLKTSKAQFNDIGVHYNTFGSERYIMTEQVWSLHDAILGIPYDQVVILCNSEVYGGGGIYNFYATTYFNPNNGFVLVHEFGHSFAGLGDEYSENDSDAGLVSIETEPWERNITSLKDFKGKWEDMLEKSTPVPTPCTEKYNGVGVFEGAAYQSKGMYRPYQDCLMRSDAPFCPVCTREILRMINYLCQ